MTAEDHASLVRRVATAPNRADALAELAAVTGHLVEKSGRGVVLSDANLSSLDLSGTDLRGAVLNRTQLHGTDLRDADLSGAGMICPGMERTDLRGANLSGAYVHALAAQTCKFDNADLTGLRDATGSLFHGCSMQGVQLPESQLAGGTFYQCDLSGTSFAGANLQGATFNECLMEGTDLSRALVSQTTITKAKLSFASFAQASGKGLVLQRATGADSLDLSDASLPGLRVAEMSVEGLQGAGLRASGADFDAVVFRRPDLEGSDLCGSRWRHCSLTEANLSSAVLTDSTFHSTALRSSRLDAAHGENLHVVESDWSGISMRGFDGRCAVFRDASLAKADLSEANLYRAMLTGDPPKALDLKEAKLARAVLVQAYIAADLTNADMRAVNAAYSRFSQSDLTKANLSGANLFQSTWVKVHCDGVQLAGVRPPWFVDRCNGLSEAIDAAPWNGSDDLKRAFERMARALQIGASGST